jgi:peroxiredoxin
MLQVGDRMPEFVLRDTQRNEVTQADFAGSPAVLAFYAMAFTGG